MSFRQTIINSLAEYFESTTIHGFSYLKASRNVLERLAWILIIGTCFILAAFLIHQSINEAHENPFMTNIETLHISKVPFPAITIDSGDPNPWGYAEKILNGLAFDALQGEELPEANELRQKVSQLLDGMIYSMNFSLQHQSKDIILEVEGVAKDYLEATCLKYPQQKQEIDFNLFGIAKKLALGGAKLGYGFEEEYVIETLKSFTNVSQGTMADSDGFNSTTCEKWALHHSYLFSRLIDSRQSRMGLL